ncbi:hypothetical protein PMKS-003118 [Pichia membranifaciens]|uniref:Uncharacterized protein n=1 Tax=Pichia membranifaciens TaxID=4926 RepID=A0A1Q2YJ84_9ASCO|nr:hypothetical protein PMKS-003118 [Pichia membranifaciens]
MPVATKRKRSRKTTFKTNPYPVQEPKTIQQNATNPFTFGPDLKTSSFSNRQNITNGGNPVFQFPIPSVDPHKATLLNDEVDMYFPRKHFLSKYQMLNDLLENIIIKPIPTDKIIPPRLFPIAFVDGMPYEKKRAELLKDVKTSEVVKPKSQDDRVELNRDDEKKNGGATLQLDQTERELKKETEDNEEATPNAKSEVVNDSTSSIDRKEEENKNEMSKDGKDKSKHNAENSDAKSSKKNVTGIGTVASVNDIDDDLSDYDPDVGRYQVPYPKDSPETTKVINDYLKSRMNIKVRTDFLFGDLETMRMQENALAETETATQQKVEEPFEFSERFNYNMNAIDDLHQTFLSYTASSAEGCESKVNEIESVLKTKFKTRLVDSNEKRQFKTQAFDSIKTGLTAEAYNDQFKKANLEANSIPQSLSSATPLLQTENNESVVPGESTDDKISHNTQTSPTSRLSIEQSASISFSPHDLVAANAEGTLVSASQSQTQDISPSLPLAHGHTAVANQIPGQNHMNLVPQDASQLNDHVSDVEKGLTSTDLVEDLTKKPSSNDMNTFLKSQNNFDFENEMLYDSGDYNNDDNDGDFGSLSNEVFLNM